MLELPFDRPRPARQSHRGAQLGFELSRELVEAVRALAQREGASSFMLLLASFQALLYRYSGQADIRGENVGVYGINQGDLALNSGNYDLSYQGNNLTITKALLNVIADGKTKVYGDADPSLTYQVSGLKNGDTAGAVLNGGSLSVKDLHQESHEKSKGNLAWQSSKGKGQTDETVRQSQLVAQGNLAIKAVEGLKIDLKHIDQKTVSQTIDAMVQADPRQGHQRQHPDRRPVRGLVFLRAWQITHSRRPDWCCPR